MKLKRMAVVAAAAVVGPTVLMATPAMADEAKNTAVTTPDAEPKGDAAPEADPYSGPKLSLGGLPKDGFTAGGDWTELSLRVDNTGKAQVPGYFLGLDFSGTERPIKGTHIEVEQRVAGVWKPAIREAGPGPMGATFSLADVSVQQDKAVDIQVRVRVAADAAAAPFRIRFTGTNHTSVDSLTASYESRITRAGEGEQTATGPKLSLDGLPHQGFRAGDDVWRNLTVKVDNSGRAGTGEYRVGVDLVTEGAERLRADQVKVEFLATTVDGRSYWHPVEVTEENGKLRILDYGSEYAAGEKRDLVFHVLFAGDTPGTPISLSLVGAGNPHHGGAVSDTATYYSQVIGSDEAAQVEGPRMAFEGIPASGFQAGADWQNLTLHLDNAGRGDVENFLLSTHMGRGVGEGPWVTTSQVQLQARGAYGWYDIELGGSEEVMGGDIGRVSLKSGAKTSVELRIRFTGDTAPGAFHLSFDGYVLKEATNEFVSSRTDTATTTIVAASTGNGGQTGGNTGGGTGTGGQTGGNTGGGTGTGGQTGGNTGGSTGNTPNPNGGSQPVVNTGTTATTPATGGQGGQGGQLAATGADPATTWALGGAAVAVAMGAALVAGTGRRRRPTA
ncbi:hypothetical protein [Streptomyces sp. NPDC048340]|uniref:hypothetical protein n=1 Tax=Streptomyces sp. NPDC048340 TaxID=3365537 RepID=UPI003718490D